MSPRSPAARGRPIARVLLSLGVVCAFLFGALLVSPPPMAGGSSALVGAVVSGSPFKGSGSRPRVTLTVELAERVELTVRVHDHDGRALRTLVDRRQRGPGVFPIAWDGRDGTGRLVPDGPYRMRVAIRASSGDASLERWVTKAPGAPYPVRPSAIVVAINPGHGGSDRGAVVDGTREAALNLDIARRLRRMLEASGIRVVMTRSSDDDVNRPRRDRNGDGRVTHVDELVARNDVANLARADLTLNVHNNATVCRCGRGTEMFVNDKRPWAAESRRLARAVQAAHISRLRPFETRLWKVIDRGIGTGDYFSLRPATSNARRPSLMPAILGESLYLDRRRERARLRDPAVRTALAAAYFDGVTAWLATRRYSVRYASIQVPDELPAGGAATVRLRLTNTGTRSTSSWRLEARVVKRVPFFDGSGTPGLLVGSVHLPDALPPGASVDLEVPITMPDARREWLLKLDVVRPAGRLSQLGVVQPQSVIVTVAPDATAEPAADPTSEPTMEPTDQPSLEPSFEPLVEPLPDPTRAIEPDPTPSVAPDPSLEPTAEPTAAPTAEPTAAPTAEPTPEPSMEPTAEPSMEPTAEPSMELIASVPPMVP